MDFVKSYFGKNEPGIWKKTGKKVFNWPEVHFYRSTSYKIHSLRKWIFQKKILHHFYLKNVAERLGYLCKICKKNEPLFATYSLTNSTLDEFQSMLVFHKPKNIGDKIKQVLPFLPASFQDYLDLDLF